MKSERKRQAVIEAISTLQQQGVPVTKGSVAKQAHVSYPFLSKHADLLQAIEQAGGAESVGRLSSAVNNQGKDLVIAALQRRLDALKQQVQEKDAELRRKQREIDQLYGKLASRSVMTNAELRAKLAEALQRLQVSED
jgi:nitrate/nitrite-specific signal transduction histidine kinase